MSPHASVAVVGLGNTGSHAVSLLPGIAGVSHVGLIDHDRYAPSNLGKQRISASDVGRSKVEAQARVLRACAPDIAVDMYDCPIEAVPLGKLRGCAILSCVDNRSARQSINRIAARLGLPWMTAGSTARAVCALVSTCPIPAIA
jgi:molybdopterin/thiamine biosynthesis adenylyltransferase